MRIVGDWQAERGLSLIHITSSVLHAFASNRQYGFANEAGGILLGCRRGAHFEVTGISLPQPTDRATPRSFQRNIFGHQQLATETWSRGSGMVDHIGEWHTHAESVPKASRVDVRAWTDLAARRKRPMLGLIVGQQQLFVARCEPHGDVVVYAVAASDANPTA